MRDPVGDEPAILVLFPTTGRRRARDGGAPGAGVTSCVRRARGAAGPQPGRPLVITGGIAALAAAGSGLAVLITLTAIGWITAPHVGIGTGLVGVLRTAGTLWLVAHHVGFTVRGAGHIGLLPLGLVLLPGVLLAMAGRWVVRAGSVTRLRHVGYAAVALALPYALLAGNQSPEDMMPAVLPAPTLSGNSTGEFAPFDRNMNRGLNFSCTRLLTAAYASSFCVPPTMRSGFFAAIAAITGERSAVSDG